MPFQIAIDVIQLNTTEWYQHLTLHDYLDYLNFRFANRKSRWKGNEGFYNAKISEDLKSIDQLCYSSQFYFVISLYVSGLCKVMIGMQSLLWVENYNCFGDQATLPISAVTIVFCFIIHKLSMLFGRCFNVWKIDEKVEREGATNTAEGDDFEYLLSRMNERRSQAAPVQFIDEDVPDHLRF